MKRFFAFAALMFVAASLTTGCKKETGVEKTETVTTPGGETTKTESVEVQQSGENPPAPNP